MANLGVFEMVTLDGVMQAPGRADEDTRGGFRYGGWAAPYADAVSAGYAGRGNNGSLLFGRRTYEDFYSVWPNATDNPFTEILNRTPKYVASRTLEEPLAWMNSTLLKGEAVEAVRDLKRELVRDMIVLGSGELVHSLVGAGLVDQFILLIHPLILGSGKRLFPEPADLRKLRLTDTTTTTTGVVIATYVAG